MLKLDIGEMQTRNPILYEQLRDAVNPANWLGLILPPSEVCQHASVMEGSYLHHALSSFQQLWDSAVPINATSAPYAVTTAAKPRRG